MHELLNHKLKLKRFTTDSNGQFTCKENCMCTITDREWLDPAIAWEYLSIRLLLIVHYLLVLFFSALKSQPSQACRPPSCSKCQLANLEDYQTPCLYVKKLVDSVWNNSCFYWLMWSGPIVIFVILEKQWAQAYHFLRTNPIICGKFAKKREELPLPLFDLVNSTTSFLLWKQKKCTATFFLYVGFDAGKWTTISVLRPSLT